MIRKSFRLYILVYVLSNAVNIDPGCAANWYGVMISCARIGLRSSAMACKMLDNFIRKRGIPGLLWFQNALNDGMSAREIAVHFGVSEPRIIQWKKEFFDNRFVFNERARDFLETEESFQQHQLHERVANLRKEMANDGTHLRLLYPNKVNPSVKEREG